jgi:phenylacetate-CoA ligase
MSTFLRRQIPRPLRRLARVFIGIIGPRYRLGRHYKEVQRLLHSAQWWDSDTIKAWQLQRLKQIVEYAFKNVPGYYHLYKKAGLHPSDIQTLEDVRLLPYVTKEMLRDNLTEFSSRAIPKRCRLYATTGGSTGVPFGFFQTAVNGQIEDAFMHLGWKRVGWELGDRSAVLTGAFVGSAAKFWKYDNYERTLLLSSYYLIEDSYDRYVRKLLQYKPSHLRAYPSVATILSDLVLTKGDVGKIPLKTIFLGSENVYDWQKRKLQSAFPEARIFAWYGHAEQVILTAMCEYSDQYHVWPFYGLTELCDEEGVEVSVGEAGELVGTSFWNFVTPFIRYRTQDLAKKGNSRCDQCGRRFPLLESVEGRLQELIVTRNGRHISMTAMNMHSDIFDNVKQFQFHQMAPGKVSFRIVRKDSYTEKDTERIYTKLLQKLGPDMELDIVFVEVIDKTQNGKFRFLKQELDVRYGD